LLLVDELYKLVMRQKEKRAQKRIELE